MLPRPFQQVISLAFAAVLLGGCVTADEVKEIVESANRESVVANLAGAGADLQPAGDAARRAGWEQEVARIEDFIVNHPDRLRTINALRIREAVLLLNAGQVNLARAVFSEVDRGQLAGERDLAIYDARDPLVWWYGLGTAMSGEDRAKARAALTGIARVANDLERTTYTRRFLEETRVRIALRLARSLSDPASIRAVLDEAMSRYDGQFDAVDREAIQGWHKDGSDSPDVPLMSLRWYDYAPRAFTQADQIIAGACVGDCPSYTPPWIACIEDSSCR